MVQQLEKEANALKQRLHEYNKEQLLLRAASKVLDEKKQETLSTVLIPVLRCIFPSFSLEWCLGFSLVCFLFLCSV